MAARPEEYEGTPASILFQCLVPLRQLLQQLPLIIRHPQVHNPVTEACALHAMKTTGMIDRVPFLSEAVLVCFDTLNEDLRVHPLSPASVAASAAAVPDMQFPLFVTLTRSGDLRGCIGTLGPTDLRSGIPHYTRQSAFRDRRFSPLKAEELPQLSISLSVLHDFEPCDTWSGWDINTHGIQIDFVDSQGSHRSATYLPGVVQEQRWNKQQQAIDSLIKKSGSKDSSSPALLAAMKVTRYQSAKVECAYCEWIDARK